MRSPNRSNVYSLCRFREAMRINVGVPGSLDYACYRVEELEPEPGPRFQSLWAQLRSAAKQAIPRGRNGVETRRKREDWIAHRLGLLGVSRWSDPLPDLEAKLAELEAATDDREAMAD